MRDIFKGLAAVFEWEKLPPNSASILFATPLKEIIDPKTLNVPLPPSNAAPLRRIIKPSKVAKSPV
ncbi:MAG: hypothetical protein MZV65_01470 [Chromatiales bacterium]|nr:hypothetical protein [Chromatiales bacterium]